MGDLIHHVCACASDGVIALVCLRGVSLGLSVPLLLDFGVMDWFVLGRLAVGAFIDYRLVVEGRTHLIYRVI